MFSRCRLALRWLLCKAANWCTLNPSAARSREYYLLWRDPVNSVIITRAGRPASERARREEATRCWTTMASLITIGYHLRQRALFTDGNLYTLERIRKHLRAALRASRYIMQDFQRRLESVSDRVAPHRNKDRRVIKSASAFRIMCAVVSQRARRYACEWGGARSALAQLAFYVIKSGGK